MNIKIARLLCKVFGHVERPGEWIQAKVFSPEVNGRCRDVQCARCDGETRDLEREGILFNRNGWWYPC